MPLLLRFAEIRRSLPELYWIVWIGTLVNRMGGFVGPLLTFYLMGERGLSLAAAGRIVSLYGAGAVIAGGLGGVLADRLGRRATLLLSLLGGALLMAALAFQRDPLAIALNAFALGLAAELYRPAVAAFVSDVVEPAAQPRAFGYLYWVINLSFAFSCAVGGTLARWSFTALFAINAAAMLGYAAVIALRLPETRPALPARAHGAARPALAGPDAVRAVSAPVDPARAASLLAVLGDRTFMVFWGLSFGLALLLMLSAVPLSGHLASQGYAPATFGGLLALNGVLIVLLQPIITARSASFDRSHVLAVAALLMGGGFALHGVSPQIAVHAAAIALWTCGEIAASPINPTVVASLSTSEARGRYQGTFSMSWSLASVLGPLAGGTLLERAGPHVLWGGCLAVGAVLAVGFLLSAPGRRARGA